MIDIIFTCLDNGCIWLISDTMATRDFKQDSTKANNDSLHTSTHYDIITA